MSPTSNQEAERKEKQTALKLVIPSHEETPRVDLTYRIGPVDDKQVPKLRAPVGNVVYLALRDCPGTHPAKGEARLVALEFVIERGKVVDVTPRAVRRKEGGEAVGEEARRCVLRKVEGKGVDLPEDDEQLAGKRLEVAAQARLFWREVEPSQ